MNRKRKPTGWNTLWPWVIAVFVAVIAAWVWLIRLATDHAPEPIPIEPTAQRQDG